MDRESIVKDREYLKRSGLYDMVTGYYPQRDYSVVVKKYVDENFLNLDQTIPQTVENGATIFKDGITHGVPDTVPTALGSTYWDVGNKTLSTVLENGVIGQHFEEALTSGQNDTGSTLENGKVATYLSSIGNSGNIRVGYTLASASEPTFMTLGIFTQDILDGESGKITIRGKVRGIQTDGANYSETWVDADILYKSSTIAGGLTNVAPEAPIPAIPMAVVISAHATNGTLEVRPTYPNALTMLTDVDGTPLDTTGQILVWDNVREVFDFTSNIIDEYVPYTGANADVDLGEHSLNVGVGVSIGSTNNANTELVINQDTSTVYSPIGATSVWDMAFGITANTSKITGMDFKNENVLGQVRLLARNDVNDYIVMNTFGSSVTTNFFGSAGNTQATIFSNAPTDSDKDFSIGTYNAGDLILGTGNAKKWLIDHSDSGALVGQLDNQKIYLGASQDCYTLYDGTNMWINTANVGSGKLFVGNYSGAINAGILSNLTTWNTGFVRSDGINAVGTLTSNNSATTRGISVFARTRGTPSAPTAVVSGDYLGDLLFGGYDGANLQYGAGVFCFVDGAVSSGSVPMRISFVTGASGGTRKERLKVDYLGNIIFTSDTASVQLDADNIKFYFGADQDSSIYHDGTNMFIKTNEVTASDLKINCGTDKTIILEETVWNDIQFQISSGRVGVANFPDWDTFTTNTGEYKFAVNDYIDLGTNEMMHDWKEGTAVYPHVHITLDGANASGSSQYVKFTLYFAYADANEVWTETSVDVEEEIPTGTADMTHVLANGVNIALTNNKIGSQVKIRIKRISATSGTEYPNHIFVTQVGLHYEVDALGSRQIGTK